LLSGLHMRGLFRSFFMDAPLLPAVPQREVRRNRRDWFFARLNTVDEVLAGSLQGLGLVYFRDQ